MSNPIGPVTQGGVYGRENPPMGHRCGKCNNGTGIYNPACPALSAEENQNEG